jgi:hypothetical protein
MNQVEFRFVVPRFTTTKTPVLQCRQLLPAYEAHGISCPGDWGPWQTVPTVMVNDAEWQKACQ